MQAACADSPIAYYRLGEPFGSVAAHDSSAAGNNGRIGVGLGLAQPGLLAGDTDTAIVFPPETALGETFAVVASDVAKFEHSVLSVEAWVKPSEVSVAGSQIVSLGASYGLVADPVGGFEFFVAGTILGTAARVVPGLICHVVGTYDGRLMTIYVNSVARKQAGFVPTPNYYDAALYVGVDNSQSGRSNFDGTMTWPSTRRP
jgi:Concanavalin A-like lectin/glucanases superfamily